MLKIEKVDHVGIRVSDKAASIAFYELLGFAMLTDIGFEDGHPIIMEHVSGVVLNLLGPGVASGSNILMDVETRHTGITHVSFKVTSIDEAKAFLAANDIPLTGEFSFKGMDAVFIRDPDRNVVELDAYAGAEPETRSKHDSGYEKHI
jgi:lactoylglutathione lyase